MTRATATLGALFAASLVVAGCGTAGGDEDVTNATQGAAGPAGVAVGTTTMLGDVVGDIMECAGG